MSELITLARPYAVAAYRRAKETGTAEQWADALAFLAAIAQHPDIVRAAANPRGGREQFAAAFLGLCDEKVDAEAKNFARLLIDNRRMGLLKQIAELFAAYKAEDEGYLAVNVASAYALDRKEQTQLAKLLTGALGRKAQLTVTEDRSLIGGVFITAGDRVIDASVRGQLERLAKRLAN